MKTSNYLTTEKLIISWLVGEDRVLPENSFVKPIKSQYVPKGSRLGFVKWGQTEAEHIVYCHYGMVYMHPRYLRESI